MYKLTGEDKLTVYNGTEEIDQVKEQLFHKLLPPPCCGDSTKLPCSFKNCSESWIMLNRQTLLGEPCFLSEVCERDPGMTTGWTPLDPERALEKAVDLISTMSNLSPLEQMKWPYKDDRFYTAVTLIRLFVQLNYTGPEIECKKIKQQLHILEGLLEVNFESDVKKLLEVEGIEVESHVRYPMLLVIAANYLSALRSHETPWPFFLIWKFRIDFLHQRMLTRRSWLLCQRLKFYAEKYIHWTTQEGHNMTGQLLDVHGSFLCEISEMLFYYYDGILAERLVNHAMKALELDVEYSGKMGYRTKFQQTAVPQTVVNVTYTPRPLQKPPGRVFLNPEKCTPRSMALNDDTRLDRLKLEDGEDVQLYRDIDQLVLVGMMLYKKGSKAEGDLKRQEAEALINVILDSPYSWSARVTALVSRCELEQSDRRAVDRALRQLEEVSKLSSQRIEVTDDIFRQYLFFGSGHPPITDIKVLFGEVLLSLEHWKEALEVFHELDAFDQIVRCYNMMDRRHKAEELIQQKIAETGKTPKLLVLLGDVTSDISHYQEAWTLSERKALQPVVKLGVHHFRRKEYEMAINYLSKAVKLCPLEYPCWVKLAWCYYQTEEYQEAFQAYLHAANLEYDNFQVWNNLANCALKINKKEYALRAYQVAVKCSYDEWKVWSNILTVAADLGRLNEAINAYNRILDLNKNFSSDACLDRMVNIALAEERPDSNTALKLAQLFGRVTATSARNPIIWLCYGRLLAACPGIGSDDDTKSSNFERAMQYYDKSLTLMRQNPTWKSDISQLQNIVYAITEFREAREIRQPEHIQESSTYLKGLDTMLRMTAKAVYEHLKTLLEDQPRGNEELQSLLVTLDNELRESFYTK